VRSHLDEIDNLEAVTRQSGYLISGTARNCGISSRQFRRFIREKYHITACAWRENVRMGDARRRICKGESVKAIALALGYAKTCDFCRAFKRVHGMTAMDFSSQQKTNPTALPIDDLY